MENLFYKIENTILALPHYFSPHRYLGRISQRKGEDSGVEAISLCESRLRDLFYLLDVFIIYGLIMKGCYWVAMNYVFFKKITLLFAIIKSCGIIHDIDLLFMDLRSKLT